MKTLNLEHVLIDYDDDRGPYCARAPDDPPGRSTLHPVLEEALVTSVLIAGLCEDDSEAPRELDFEHGLAGYALEVCTDDWED